ncbi:ABC transporter family substrate-binding protein [Cellulomonas carbonis]|nr:ABC transporter family substrate-binding protein [Cellulomonas carbonis]GGC15305.1 peptide ABC transporter substrate-binding protein [Cellulomonas carbonis]
MRRIGAAGAIVATGALALSACSSTPSTTTEIDEETSLSIGWNQPFYSQNNLTSVGNATTNSNVIYLTNAAFNYYDNNLELQQFSDFGTYEVESEDPLTVTYTINEGATWSDGTPVDAVDVFLYWGAQNDSFDNVAPEYDEEGNITNQDAIDAGVYFDSSSVAMNLISEPPTISDDGLSITFVYDEPRSDWEISVQPSPIAAHALAAVALGTEDAEEGKQRVVDAFTNNVTEDLSALAKSWNEDFNFTSLPEDENLYLSSGPYVMTDYVENQYLTLSLREDYSWGPMPSVDEITIRYSEDPLASVTALQNGEVDIIEPQASVDVIETLEGIEGVEYTTAPTGTYEHVDLIFNNGGPFDPATYGGDAAKAQAVRQAFLLSVPRDEIIEKLVQPLQPDAEPRESHTVTSEAPAYDDVVAGNGSEFYRTSDPAKAAQLLADAGVATPIDVRFLYGASNVRRANTFELIKASAAEAGFNVIDEGDDNWGSRLSDTASYDASLFGWQSTNTYALNSEANFVTGGLNNFAGMSDPDIDAWYAEMSTNTDPEQETELTILIEERLNELGFSLPLYQHPGVMAYRDSLQNVETIALSPTVFWNFWEWEVGGDTADEE